MQTEQIVALLIAERDRLNHAIQVLQGHTSAKAAAPKAAPAATIQKRKPRTAAQRKAQSERMRAFWAARRKQKAK